MGVGFSSPEIKEEERELLKNIAPNGICLGPDHEQRRFLDAAYASGQVRRPLTQTQKRFLTTCTAVLAGACLFSCAKSKGPDNQAGLSGTNMPNRSFTLE